MERDIICSDPRNSVAKKSRTNWGDGTAFRVWGLGMGIGVGDNAVPTKSYATKRFVSSIDFSNTSELMGILFSLQISLIILT